MMVIVCTRHTPLVRLCAELFGRENEVKQLLDFQMLKNHVSTPGDLLIVDLESCKEKNVPAMRTPTVALANVLDYDQAMRLLRKGVRGYGNRHMHPDNLLQAANVVRAGQIWLPPSIVTQLITSIPESEIIDEHASDFSEPLSKREEEVAQLVTQGLSNKEIADKIYVSVRTVKAHLTSIFAKTGFRDRLELAVKMKKNDSRPTPAARETSSIDQSQIKHG